MNEMRRPAGPANFRGGTGRAVPKLKHVAGTSCASVRLRRATMANRTLTQELLDLENQFWRALKQKDVDAAVQLTDEECIVTGAQGIERLNKQQLSDLLKNAP